MSSIQVTLEGDTEKLMEKLGKMKNIDKAGINKALSEALRTSTVERFDSGTAPDGGKWKRSIRASGGGGKTLIKDNDLRNSIRDKANNSGFSVGTNTIYAATHQFGDSRTIKAKNGKYLCFQIGGAWRRVASVKITIPARPFLGISKEDEQEIKSTLESVFEG